MKKMIIYISIIVVIIILLVGACYFMWSKYQTAKVILVQDFFCPGMTGFTFKYPVFEGWVNDDEMVYHKDTDSCIPRPIKNTLVAPKKHIWMKILKQPTISQNNSDLVNKSNLDGILYQKGQDSVKFYGNSFSVEISIDFGTGGKYNFPSDLFFQTIIESFKLTN